MTVSLTRAEADKMISEITSKKEDAISKLNQIADAQEQMLGANWHGDSASTYGQTSQAQREEFDEIIKTLTHTVDVGSHHLASITSADNG